MEQSQGFVGQRQAREALGLHLSLLRMGRHSGRPLLLVGPPGTGKVSQAQLGFVEVFDRRRMNEEPRECRGILLIGDVVKMKRTFE
jgi:Holliday junction resolvasome RuvABC ATP-dependent DNA helicase subunit